MPNRQSSRHRARRLNDLKRQLAAGFERGTCLLYDMYWLETNQIRRTEARMLSSWIADTIYERLGDLERDEDEDRDGD